MAKALRTKGLYGCCGCSIEKEGSPRCRQETKLHEYFHISAWPGLSEQRALTSGLKNNRTTTLKMEGSKMILSLISHQSHLFTFQGGEVPSSPQRGFVYVAKYLFLSPEGRRDR